MAMLPGPPPGQQQWAALWACPVLFADEPARAARLQGLATQQRRLGAQQAELQGRLDEKAAVRAVIATGVPVSAVVCRTADAQSSRMALGLHYRPKHAITNHHSRCVRKGGRGHDVYWTRLPAWYRANHSAIRCATTCVGPAGRAEGAEESRQGGRRSGAGRGRFAAHERCRGREPAAGAAGGSRE